MKEIWKPVPGYEGFYIVSNLGNVRRIKPGKGAILGKNLKPHNRKDGYHSVRLSVSGKSKAFLVHTLVMKAFVGEAGNNQEIHHRNGEKQDNRLGNLQYVTRSEHMHMSAKQGKYKHKRAKGRKVATSKLTPENVREIRRLVRDNANRGEVAKKFNISRGHVNAICRRDWWNHIN